MQASCFHSSSNQLTGRVVSIGPWCHKPGYGLLGLVTGARPRQPVTRARVRNQSQGSELDSGIRAGADWAEQEQGYKQTRIRTRARQAHRRAQQVYRLNSERTVVMDSLYQSGSVINQEPLVQLSCAHRLPGDSAGRATPSHSWHLEFLHQGLISSLQLISVHKFPAGYTVWFNCIS